MGATTIATSAPRTIALSLSRFHFGNMTSSRRAIARSFRFRDRKRRKRSALAKEREQRVASGDGQTITLLIVNIIAP